MAETFEINVNVNGASAGTGTSSNNVATGAATGVIAGAATGMGISGLSSEAVSTANLWSATNLTPYEGKGFVGGVKGWADNRKFGRAFMKSANSLTTFQSSGMLGRARKDGLFQGAAASKEFAAKSAINARDAAGSFLKKTGPTAALAATTAYLKYQSQAASLAGNSYKSDVMSERASVIGDVTGIAAGILVAGAVGGGLMIARKAYSIAMEAKVMAKSAQDETVRTQYYSDRLKINTTKKR